MALDIDPVDYPQKTPDYIGSYMFDMALYGVYIVLFVFCVYLLLVNKRTSKWLFLAAAVTLFAISTADTSITIYYAFSYVLPGKKPPPYHAYPRYLFFITNNVLADSIFLYRCYVVWHYKKLVIIIPCAILLLTTMCGYLFVISRSQHIGDLLPLYLWMIFALNISITVLIAGKLFWNARRARSILGSETTGRSYPFSAIIIESGVIYSIYMLLGLVVPIIFFDAGLIQIVGIIPTLIIIRIGLGGRTRDATPLHRAEMQSSTPILDSIFSTVGTVPATELTPDFEDNTQVSSYVESNSATYN